MAEANSLKSPSVGLMIGGAVLAILLPPLFIQALVIYQGVDAMDPIEDSFVATIYSMLGALMMVGTYLLARWAFHKPSTHFAAILGFFIAGLILILTYIFIDAEDMPSALRWFHPFELPLAAACGLMTTMLASHAVFPKKQMPPETAFLLGAYTIYLFLNIAIRIADSGSTTDAGADAEDFTGIGVLMAGIFYAGWGYWTQSVKTESSERISRWLLVPLLPTLAIFVFSFGFFIGYLSLARDSPTLAFATAWSWAFIAFMSVFAPTSILVSMFARKQSRQSAHYVLANLILGIMGVSVTGAILISKDGEDFSVAGPASMLLGILALAVVNQYLRWVRHTASHSVHEHSMVESS